MITQKWKARLYGIGALVSFILAAGILYVTFTGEGAPVRTDRPAQRPTNSSYQHPLQSQKAPDFTLERMNGDSFRLADHRGEVVVVNFWATWCPPCRREIPGFIELQKEWGDKGLTFVGVSLDEEGFDAVRPYAEKMGINYPLVVDDGSVAQKYEGVSALPTSFVVGPEGTVQYARPGFLPESVLRDQVAPLLKRARANE
mgnify:FL=1